MKKIHDISNLRNQRRSQGLPVNVIVMLMIGLLLFGAGIGLFTKISTAGEDQVNDLNNQIKSDIASLECENDQGWICVPSYTMNSGDRKTFEVYVTNIGETTKEYSVEFKLNTLSDGKKGVQKDCGDVLIDFADAPVQIQSGSSASYPFIVRSSRIVKTPCSFITTVYLMEGNDIDPVNAIDKTTVIIRVEK